MNANLALRCLLELGALAAVGYWGWTSADGALRFVLAAAAVRAVVVVWALFVAPKASMDVALPVRFAIEIVVWIAAGAALFASGQRALAVAFVAVALASGTLNYRARAS